MTGKSGLSQDDTPSFLHLPEEELRRPAERVERLDAELQSAIDDMLRLLHRTGYPAVAAPQVGVLRRAVAVDLSRTGRSPVVLVNPVVSAVSAERSVDLEGCLSLPGLVAKVARPERIRITGLARTGQIVRLEAGGLLARILQHKVEHLDGILFLDHLAPLDRAFLERRAPVTGPRCSLSRTAPGAGPRQPEEAVAALSSRPISRKAAKASST
ncbi:MAG: peptide deformylase [Gemmatimonadota bacterium]